MHDVHDVHEDPPLFGHRTVTAEAVATFGGLTGDYSRIHFDHELGRTSPHGVGFAHGLLSASWALGAMTLHTPERLGCGEARAHPAGFRVRYHDLVRFGDTLALRCSEGEAAESVAGSGQRNTEFSFVNQEGRVATSGTIEIRTLESSETKFPLSDTNSVLWPATPHTLPAAPDVWAAEDIMESGPRGAAAIRTVSETDVVNYVHFSGEANPLYMNAAFAEGALFGERIVPPMLCFCLGFSVWLRGLLRLPMAGDASSAGHLGDRWQFVAPVLVGDTLEVRHRPLALRRCRTRPTQGIATFGLQLVNQHGALVQQGEVDMMLAMRANETESGDSHEHRYG